MNEKDFLMRMILLAGAALALSACGGGGSEANNMASDNMMLDQNMMMDENMMMDANMSVNGMSTMDANGAMGADGAMGANAQNMTAMDAATNDPDTNLANGL
jgi:hypothetical protein